MDPLTGLVSLGGGLLEGIGGIFSNNSQKKMAREQMAFQERMSNTAHRREVADLAFAGLNPILSAKYGGASSPGGAQPNIVNPLSGLGQSARNLADKMYQGPLLDAQVKNAQLQNDVLKEQIEQLKISNAQASRYTPIHNTVGDAVEYGVKKVKDFLGDGDPVLEVIEAGEKALNGGDLPSSAKSSRSVPFGSRDSEARKWANSGKSFFQSLKDANTPLEKKLYARGVADLPRIRAIQSNMRRGHGY